MAEKPLTHLKGIKGPLVGDERSFEEYFFTPRGGVEAALHLNPKEKDFKTIKELKMSHLLFLVDSGQVWAMFEKSKEDEVVLVASDDGGLKLGKSLFS